MGLSGILLLFLLNIFDPQLVESADAESVGMEGRLCTIVLQKVTVGEDQAEYTRGTPLLFLTACDPQSSQ